MSTRSLSVLICPLEMTERGELISRLLEFGGVAEAVSVRSFEPAGESSADVVFFCAIPSASSAGHDLQGWLDSVILPGSAGRNKLIALISINDARRVPQLYQTGFTAFIAPNASTDEMESAMRSVRQGGVYLGRELADTLFSSDGNRQRYIAAVGLTAREQEVLRLLAVNMSNKDVARRLSLSVRTVETHRLNIRKKTNAGNWRELAGIAERLGLLGDYDFFSGLAERVAAPGFHED